MRSRREWDSVTRSWCSHSVSLRLAATPSWVAEGGVAEANFGHSLDSAGDVNGDGFSDALVGAPGWYDLFPNQNIEGAAFVYLGSEAGLGASAAWIAEGEQAGARLGYAVARAGDVNGDGYSDVVVGADQYNSDGGAFAFHGSASGLGATPAWSVDSVGFGAYFGAGVASAGDVDGDGFGDVIVGAPFYSGGQNFEGSAWLYHGSPTGLSTVYDWAQQSNIQGAEYGRAVAGAGDLNGDGFGDVVIGAALANATSAGGRAYMYFGNEGDGLDHAVRQRRASDLAPIAVLGHSESSSSFRVAGLARSPAGRSRLAFEWEVKPFGTPLDGTGLARSPVVDSGFPGAPGSVVQVNALVSGLANGTDYVWRVRVVGSSPLFPHSRWLVLPDNQPGEMDFQTEATTAVAESSTPRAAGGLILEPCHPNPFNPRTTLTYELAEAGLVEIRIFDTMGRTLAVPVSRVVAAGRHQLDWEARDESGKPLASGAYYLRCAAGGEVKTQKIVVMK